MKTKKNKLTFSILSLGLIISPIFSLYVSYVVI